MGKLIDLDTAIDAVEKESQVDGAYGYMDTKSIVDLLNDLPSVQPDIIHCRDCKHWQSEEHIGNNNVHTLNIASLPCKNWLTGGDWYCGSAERRSNE